MEPPEDDDPVVASYDVLFNPSLPAGQHLYLLQHLSRLGADTTPRAAVPPAEMRLKSRGGMVELDYPLDTTVAYDQEKGMQWGRVLRASMEAKGGGSHGLAGGFGVGTAHARPRRRAAAAAADDEDDDMDEYGDMSWNDAVSRDLVLRTQTVGGLVSRQKYINHMVGVFQAGEQPSTFPPQMPQSNPQAFCLVMLAPCLTELLEGALHLTPVHAIVSLRPQLHHLDAAAQSEQAASRATQSAKDGPGGTSTNPGAGPGAPAGTANAAASGPAARAIHMTVKGAADDDTLTTDTMADRLRGVQQEPWRRLAVAGEDSDDAWAAFHEGLVFGGEAQPDPPRLATDWGDRELFDAISGIKRVAVAAGQAQEKGKDKATAGTGGRTVTKDADPAAAAEPKRGRPRGRAAAPKRPAKGKGKADVSMAMDLTE